MIYPPALQSGDTVAIVSTARKIDVSQKQEVQQTIESWGYSVMWGKHIESKHHQFCGTDEERAADLQAAIDDPNVKGILCFRGGYGTIRILDKVDLTPLIKDPKWIAGYSDVTALLGALQQKGISALHSTMPVNFSGNTKEALGSLRNVFSGKGNVYQTPVHAYNRNGLAEGELVGGNLSMLYSIAGTPFDFNYEDKILFLEDLDEYLYHVDRMMQNLKHRGILARIKGLIVGGMTDMNDNTVPFGQSAEEIIQAAVKDYDYPVCFGFPVGHQNDNRVMIIGKSCRLSVSDSGVTFEQ
jgi:muramoyltetrapeptide carboxypeptidase